jgi:hypothetical protein
MSSDLLPDRLPALGLEKLGCSTFDGLDEYVARSIRTAEDSREDIEMGYVALAIIHAGKLYKATHRTFEAYTEERHGRSRKAAYRWVHVGEAMLEHEGLDVHELAKAARENGSRDTKLPDPARVAREALMLPVEPPLSQRAIEAARTAKRPPAAPARPIIDAMAHEIPKAERPTGTAPATRADALLHVMQKPAADVAEQIADRAVRLDVARKLIRWAGEFETAAKGYPTPAARPAVAEARALTPPRPRMVQTFPKAAKK